jgi:DNA-binding FadR family transcriptional regulator
MDKIRKINLSEAVSENLLSMIQTGSIQPGQRLPPENKLVEMLGVSRTAIREGVKTLAGINVLIVQPGKGTFVNQDPDLLIGKDALLIALERESFETIVEMRTVLDVGIAKFAAIKATAKDLLSIEKALDLMDQSIATDPPDIVLFSKGDQEFHLALCEAAHNNILKKVGWPLVSHTISRGWKSLSRSLENIPLAIEAHKKIFRAIKARDQRKAMHEMEMHLTHVFRNYKKSVETE